MKASMRTLIFVLSALATIGPMAAAFADDGWDHHRHEEWREREWRRHHPPQGYYVAPPVVYAAPTVVYAAPPPVAYAVPVAPSATFVFPLNFR